MQIPGSASRRPVGRPWPAAALLLLLFASPSRAQAPPNAAAPAAQGHGRVVGHIEDVHHDPVSYANIRFMDGLKMGITSDENGNFVLAGVPAGTHQLQAAPLGFDPQTQTVVVTPGGTVTVSFTVHEPKTVKTLGEIEVRAHKTIDTKSSRTVHSISGEKLQDTPVDGIMAAVALQAGVVAQGGALHVRGGRAGELKTRVDDVETSDPLTGRAANIASLAVAGADVISGGFDAEFGNALSGVVNITTREGTDKFGGQVRWDTDRYGDPTKTFDNFDRFTFGFGGPTAIKHLTYFATYEGTFTDTYLKTSLTKPSHTLFDFLQFGNRQSNQINTNLKFAYKPNDANKITFETINNRRIFTPYNHMWSRQGFVKVSYDTNLTTGAVTPRYGTWSFSQDDSSFVPENMPDHVPTTDDKYRSLAAGWTWQASPKTVVTARASDIVFDLLSSVGHKEPWEYEIQSPFYWSGNTVTGSENNPYFATHGDLPFYTRNYGSTAALKADLSTNHWRSHTMKTGFEAKYNHVANLGIVGPNLESNGQPGQVRSDFDNYNPEGSAYAQDRWEYEGLVLNAGVRYDLFSPGLQISDLDLASGKRYKQQFSPRLGIAYPISDKDVLSFHYGWTYQTPSRAVIFQNRGAGQSVNTLGNPDLEPETNVAYQAGMQHLFSRDLSGQFTVFFRDIYGLIRIRQKSDEYGNLVNVWTNGDYASARGFEASLSKSFSHKFSADLSYSYQIATGVASNPASALTFFNGGALYLPISEQPLDWDQRNTLNLSANVRDPGKWGFRVLWSYGSGLPFTPTFRNDRVPDPALNNSRVLPSSSTLTLDGDKFYRVWGQNLTVFFDARNILDAKIITALAQPSFPNNNIDRDGSSDYLVYYTETGRAGGAYLQDINGDGVDDWVPVNDPRVFAEGRNVRLGIRLSF